MVLNNFEVPADDAPCLRGAVLPADCSMLPHRIDCDGHQKMHDAAFQLIQADGTLGRLMHR